MMALKGITRVALAVVCTCTMLMGLGVKAEVAAMHEWMLPVQRQEEELKSIGVWTVTAYCPCTICCGAWAENREGEICGAAGTELVPGKSAAAPLPFGTKVIVEGKEWVVQDRTADWVVEKYGGKIIDLYFATHEEALEWGKREIAVFVKEEE